MKEIKLTQGYVALVDDEDFEYLNQFSWHADKSKTNIYASRKITVNGKRINQRMQWDVMGNKWCDHIDLNGLNNQKSNLRKCTKQQNNMNQKPRKNSSSKFKGVSWKKKINKWQSQIEFNKKGIYIGVFQSEIEAAKAYDKKALELFGEFAWLNFKQTA